MNPFQTVSYSFKTIFLILFLSVTSLNSVSSQNNTEVEVMIPLYQLPYTEWNGPFKWQPVLNVHNKVKITTIINPDSGPTTDGPTLDNFVKGIKKLNANSIPVYGYISTSYLNPATYKNGAYPTKQKVLEAIRADIDLYAKQIKDKGFQLSGIFFDEVANVSNTLNDYRSLRETVKSKNSSWKVILNVGVKPKQDFLGTSRPAGDIVVAFENYYNKLNTMTKESGSAKKYAAIVHSISQGNILAANNAVATAKKNNYGYVYVTDDQMPNPFDQFPTFWGKIINFIRLINNPVNPGDLKAALISNGWRTPEEVAKMTSDNQRNTIIVELNINTSNTVAEFQTMDNVQITGHAAVFGALFFKHRARTKSQLSTMSIHDQRNTLIVELSKKYPQYTIPQLQAKDNFELAKM